MHKKSVKLEYSETQDIQELSNQDRALLDHAKDISKSAYSPYSNFQVGAAIRLKSGELVTGSNQENIAFPSGLCAERVAMFSTSALYPNETIDIVAVYAEGEEADDIIPPCGACRQVLSEYELKQNKQIRLIMTNGYDRFFLFESVSDLLPFLFRLNRLKKD